MAGYAAGQDVAAGGRATVFTVDEAGARDFVAGGKDEAVQDIVLQGKPNWELLTTHSRVAQARRLRTPATSSA